MSAYEINRPKDVSRAENAADKHKNLTETLSSDGHQKITADNDPVTSVDERTAMLVPDRLSFSSSSTLSAGPVRLSRVVEQTSTSEYSSRERADCNTTRLQAVDNENGDDAMKAEFDANMPMNLRGDEQSYAGLSRTAIPVSSLTESNYAESVRNCLPPIPLAQELNSLQSSHDSLRQLRGQSKASFPAREKNRAGLAIENERQLIAKAAHEMCPVVSNTTKTPLVRSASDRAVTAAELRRPVYYCAPADLHRVYISGNDEPVDASIPRPPSPVIVSSERRSSRSSRRQCINGIAATAASATAAVPQLTKRNDICRRLSDAFFFWARLETFLLAICSTAIGLLLYYEFWWGSFLTYPFYRAVSPFELQSYVREMEQFMGSTDVERINILLRSRHVSEIEAEQFSRFLWQPEFCDIRYRTCTTLMQSPVHTKSSHHWVAMLQQQQQRTPVDGNGMTGVLRNGTKFAADGSKRRTSYTAVIIGHPKPSSSSSSAKQASPQMPPLIDPNNIFVPSWSVLYGAGIRGAASNVAGHSRLHGWSNNYSPSSNSRLGGDRRAFLCMRCSCQQPAPISSASTSTSTIASPSSSSPVSSASVQQQQQSSMSAIMSALRSTAASARSLGNPVVSGGSSSSSSSKQRQFSGTNAAAVVAAAAAAADVDLLSLTANDDDLSMSNDDFILSSGDVGVVDNSNNVATRDDVQSSSHSGTMVGTMPTLSILHPPPAVAAPDAHFNNDQYASFSAGGELAPISVQHRQPLNSSSSSELPHGLPPPVAVNSVKTILFQASINNNVAASSTTRRVMDKTDSEVDDDDAEPDLQAADERKRQFCFIWPQYPSDLYIHNTAQLMQNPSGGSAHDDTSEFLLDLNGNLKMFVGILNNNENGDDVQRRVSALSGTTKSLLNYTKTVVDAVESSKNKKLMMQSNMLPSLFDSSNNGTLLANISIVRWTRYYNRWKCTERTLHNALQRWRENVFMPWDDWYFHIRCNPLFMVFGKLFQLPFDLAIHWVFKLIFMAFLLKLCGNALLFAILDPYCRVAWRQRMFYLTYPVSIPMNVAVSFSLMVMTYFLRECWEWSSVDEMAHPVLDQLINIIPAISLVYFVLAIFWVSTMAARQNPTQGWWFCVNIRKFMMKGPKELTSFFLTVVNIRGGNEDEQELRLAHICRLADDDLICLICHETLDRDILVRYPGEVPILECRHIYHSACLTQWLVKSEKCPYCQEKVRLSRETLRRLYPRTRQFRLVVWLVANVSHRIGSSVYGMVARCVCEAFRDCCCICRIWIAFFSYFLAVFFVLIITRKLSIGGYDLFVYQSIEQYVRTECR